MVTEFILRVEKTLVGFHLSWETISDCCKVLAFAARYLFQLVAHTPLKTSIHDGSADSFGSLKHAIGPMLLLKILSGLLGVS